MAMKCVILAGGRSSRMGRDKALLPLQGTTLLDRLLGIAQGLGWEVAVAGRPGGLPDARANAGPLAGIASGLAWAGGPVIMLAVDLPLITAADLAWLAEAEAGPDGTVLTVEGRIEPLCARWHPALLPAVLAALAGGRRSPVAVLETAAVARHPCPFPQRLRDCDTPDEFHALQKDAR